MAKQSLNKPTKTVETESPSEDAGEDESAEVLNQVIKDFKNSRTYTESGFWETWENSWKLYNGERVKIGYDGYADTFIPETYTEVQQIKAHLVNGNLDIQFLPTSPDQSGDPATIQSAFKYAWYKDFMDAKLDVTLTEEIVTGNCYIWSYPGEDGFPKQIVVSARDCFFDPMIKNYEDLCAWGYGGYRYVTTKTALENTMIPNGQYDETDPKSEKLVPRYSNLDNVVAYVADSNDPTVKKLREELLADAALSDVDDQVEVICYFGKIDGKDHMVTIANRETVIEDVESPFQRAEKLIHSADDAGNPVDFTMPEIKPFIPVAPFRNIVDPNLWYARGDVEIIGPSQERLNDTQAQKTDNLTYQLNRMWTLDPNFAQKIDEIQSMPGAVFTIPPGALEQLVTQPIGADADNEINRIKFEMQGASGTNEAYQSTLQTTGRQSAYQINQNLVAMGARFKVKIKQHEGESLRILAQNMWKIMQIFITEETSIRIDGPQSTSWSVYNPGLYLGDWDVQIKLGATADTIKETQRQQAMQFYLLASKLPFINQQDLFLTVAPQIFPEVTKDSASQLLISPEQMAAMQQSMGAQPGEDTTDGSYEQAGMQTAGSPPVGAPTSGIANMPKVPQA